MPSDIVEDPVIQIPPTAFGTPHLKPPSASKKEIVDDLVLGSSTRDQWDKQIRVDKQVDKSTNLTKYLSDHVEENVNFGLLSWWKVNASKYPIIAEIARDVLAISLSTVASESAFSMGDRVLDLYRSSLNPSTVQALLCSQNWLRSKSPTSADEIEVPLEDYNIIGEPV